MPINYASLSERKAILDELESNEENKRRKETSLMRFEIYNSRLYDFVKEKIRSEMGVKTANQSKIISSINLTKKITDESARVYMKAPKRTFLNATDQQRLHLEKIYDISKANVKFKKANRVFKLNNQAMVQVVPKDGMIELRPLQMHHFDVVPMYNDPEKAECVIVNSFDKSRLFGTTGKGSGSNVVTSNNSYYSDSVNQKLGEPDDYLKRKIFYWWTDEYNFATNAQGEFVYPDGSVLKSETDKYFLNPIKKLPFIDIAMEKDFEYFVRAGNSVPDFGVDFSVMLSDTAEVNRMQGFAQAVMASVDEPRDLKIGPRKVLWLKIDPNNEAGTQPSFEFASPNVNLDASLKMLDSYMSLFLTSIGQSAKLVSSSGAEEKFTSGLDRFLSMIQKFEQSQDDVDLFMSVEKKAFNLIKAWNNIYSSVTENGFVPELSGVNIPEDVELEVKYVGPEMAMSDKEKLDLIQQRMELGLMSKVQGLMLDQGLTEEAAVELLKKIDSQDMLDGENKPSDEPNPIGE